MPALATITLREPADWQRVVQIVREHAKQMADKGTPLRLQRTVRPPYRS